MVKRKGSARVKLEPGQPEQHEGDDAFSQQADEKKTDGGEPGQHEGGPTAQAFGDTNLAKPSCKQLCCLHKGSAK